MQFFANIDIKPLDPPITYRHKILLTGSCFTEHIGNFLKEAKFNVLQNPNGILFDPVSVSASLVYNVVGARVVYLGVRYNAEDAIPDTYELPFHSLDFVGASGRRANLAHNLIEGGLVPRPPASAFLKSRIFS